MSRFTWFNAVSLTFGFAFLYLPMVILVVYSFNESRLVTVWAGFSTRWYGELLRNEQFLDAAWVTLRVAFFSSTIATVLGTMAAYVLVRAGRFHGRTLFSGMIYAPLVMPEVITGLSLLLLFISINLDRGILTIVLAHTTFSMCYVSVVVSSRLVSFDDSIEEAALDLGATPFDAFRSVTLPIIMPAVISGWLLAFTLSLDDLVIASFTAGPAATTLPIQIFSSVRLGVSPEINALSTILIAIIATGVVTASLISKRNIVRQAQDARRALQAESEAEAERPDPVGMSAFAAEYAAHVAAHGTPERIECMLCDMNGILRGKWIPGAAADKLATGQVRLPLSTYAPNILGEEVPESGLGIIVGDPDGALVPLPGTLKPVPWSKSAAQVLVEMTELDGTPSPYSPREVLSAVLTRYAARGWHPVVATELEFYVVQKRPTPDTPPQPPEPNYAAQNYDLEALSHHDDMLTEILEACAAQGLATDTLVAEYGPGQFEINFHHTADVFAAAETALLFRRVVREVVDGHGLEATFMAKPYADSPGNGFHAHISVLDAGGSNILSASGGVGATLGHAIAGTLATMGDLQAIFAPHLNSFRRFQPMSFAPSAPDWALDNRAAGIRVPATEGAAARLEHRIAGADVNPYLALAAILGGMIWGIERASPLPPACDAPDARPPERLSADWSGAVARFAGSDIAADIFGARYRDAYAAVRRDEIAKLTTQITRLEYRTYLTRL